MESFLNIILSTENVRTLAILVSVLGGVVWLKASMTSMHRRIDGVEVSIKELKHSTEASISELKHSTEASISELKHSTEASISELKHSTEASINELKYSTEASIKELKYNDFAHLSSAFEALTYVLEKNGSLSKADKEFVDNRLHPAPSPSL